MNIIFDVNSANRYSSQKPVKLKNAYLEGNIQKNGEKIWKIVTTKFPKLSRIYQYFKGLSKKTSFIVDKEFEAIAKAAAFSTNTPNPSHPVINNPTFQEFSKKHIVEIKTIKAIKDRANVNWTKAADKIMLLTKGFKKDAKILDEHYFQEALLPNHIFGDDAFSEFESWNRLKSPLSFEKFLTEKGSLGQKVKYLTEDQIAEFEVTFTKEGSLLNNNQILTHELIHPDPTDISKLPIFVISPTNKMYVAAPKRAEFHHSSFLAGKPILGAGEIQTNQKGELIMITNRSGHYKPSQTQLFATLKSLSDKGVVLDKVKVIEYGETVRVFKNAAQYLISQGEIKEDGIAIGENVIAEYEYNNAHELVGLRLTNQFSSKEEIVDIAKHVLDKLRINKKQTLKYILVHIGNEAYAKYPIEEYIKKEGRTSPLGIENVHSETILNSNKEADKIFYFEKEFEDSQSKIEWAKTTINFLRQRNLLSESDFVKFKDLDETMSVQEFREKTHTLSRLKA